MAHFAQMNGDTVAQVIVVNNETIEHLDFPESEAVGAAFCKSLFGSETEWKQTSYNASFRKNYAGVGFTYDDTLDAFVPPQPFPSWILNEDTAQWESPVPYPEDGNMYVWDEETGAWVDPSLLVEDVFVEEPVVEEPVVEEPVVEEPVADPEAPTEEPTV